MITTMSRMGLYDAFLCYSLLRLYSQPQPSCQIKCRQQGLSGLGPDHVDVANSYISLGIVHKKLGDLSQAKDYHDRALAIRLKRLGPDHVDVANSYISLGIVHKKLGDLSQAKDYHDRALAIRLKKLGPDHVHVAGSYNSL